MSDSGSRKPSVERARGPAASWRPWAAALVVVAAPVVLVLTSIALRDRLPDPLPTHWSGSTPDGFTSYTTFVVILSVVAVVAAVGAVAVLLIRKLRNADRRATMIACAAFGWGATGLWLGIASASLDVEDPTTASIGRSIPLFLTGFILVPVLVWLLYGRTVDPLPDRSHETAPPVADLAPDERVLWRRRLTSPLLAALGLLPIAGGLAVLVGGAPWWVFLIFVVIGVALALTMTALVVVDQRGLTVSFGPFRWPAKHIPLEEIDVARPDWIDPLRWGGWGYRGMPGRTALVLRRGPGLVIDLVDGRQFCVTLDGPEEPAGLLNGLRARSGRG